MFSILEKEDTNNLSMSISTDHMVKLERTNSQKSGSSSNSQLMTEDFFGGTNKTPDETDSTPDDEDYVVVSFT